MHQHTICRIALRNLDDGTGRSLAPLPSQKLKMHQVLSSIADAANSCFVLSRSFCVIDIGAYIGITINSIAPRSFKWTPLSICSLRRSRDAHITEIVSLNLVQPFLPIILEVLSPDRKYFHLLSTPRCFSWERSASERGGLVRCLKACLRLVTMVHGMKHQIRHHIDLPGQWTNV